VAFRRNFNMSEAEYKAATELAASGENAGLKAISQDQQLKLYGWFKQVLMLAVT
jgi:hypothetical protein